MAARRATSCRVVCSKPFSRVRASAASSNFVRVRTRLSPFRSPLGCARDEAALFAGLCIDEKHLYFVIWLFYNDIIFYIPMFCKDFKMIARDSLAAALQAFVDDGSLAGLAARIWRDGEEEQTIC